ncbi:MAG: N-acetyltransferase family protein [Desulfobacterales bacterium]
MEKVTIRVATQRDLPELLELYRQLDPEDSPVLPLADAEKIFETTNKYPDYRVYVASRYGKTLGTFALLIVDNLAHLGARYGIVEDVVVTAEWQGMGIGRQMMRFAMQKCHAAGCYKLVLSSNKKRVDAHRFYKKLGFRLHGYSFVVTM